MDEEDKKSITYFMTKMTQKEFTELYKLRKGNKDLDFGLHGSEKYSFNKIKYDCTQAISEK